jgi:hypothetical protein
MANRLMSMHYNTSLNARNILQNYHRVSNFYYYCVSIKQNTGHLVSIMPKIIIIKSSLRHMGVAQRVKKNQYILLFLRNFMVFIIL